VRETRSHDPIIDTVRIAAVVLLMTTLTVSAAAAFVVQPEVFFILFFGVLFGVFLTRAAHIVVDRLPVNQTAGVAGVAATLVLLVLGSIWVFGVRVDQQIGAANEHLAEAETKLREIVNQRPSLKSAVLATPVVGTLLSADQPPAGDAPGTDARAVEQQPGRSERLAENDGQSAEEREAADTSSTQAGSITAETFSLAADKGIGAVTQLFATTLGLVVNSVLIFFVGVFLAVAPQYYREGIVTLFPESRRDHCRELLDAMGDSLWQWLVGRFGAMLVTGVGAVLLLLATGVPLAVLLGLATGALTFVPNIGGMIALLLAVLFAVPSGPTTVALVVVGYLLLQLVESYVVTPLIQQRQAALPPALLIAFQATMGVLFGFLGAAVASPLLAMSKTLVQEGYVRQLAPRAAASEEQLPV
jgi:predicted PurR-regulated permease PerM